VAPDQERALKIVNDSGFPFQLRVGNEIERTSAKHGWHVLSPEHPWSDGSSGGFIDFVLEKRGWILRMAVECKRLKADAARWVFLVEADQRPVDRSRMFWVDGIPNSELLSGFDEFRLSPATYEAMFCALPGQAGDKPMLERVASGLITSIESVALHEVELAVGDDPPQSKSVIYLPIVVTTAQLQICRFAPGDVSLSEGTIPADKASVEDVDFVRFRKAVSTEFSSSGHGDLDSARASLERTVLVVRSAKLAEFLTAFELRPFDPLGRYPWKELRDIKAFRRR